MTRKIWILLFYLSCAVRGYTQAFGGIFDQGAEEISEYSRQIAALNLFIDRQQQGYKIMESGLADIGSVTGDEYELHQTWFGSLASVNPVVAAMPETRDILTLDSAMINGFAAAVQRWKGSARLTPAEGTCIDQAFAAVRATAAADIKTLTTVLTGDTLTTTDDERMRRIVALDRSLKETYAAAAAFAAGVDLLVEDRAGY